MDEKNNQYYDPPVFLTDKGKTSTLNNEPLNNEPLSNEPLSNEEVRCRFRFICSRKWQDLESTEADDVRYCNHCEQSVYLAKTKEDLDQFAEEKKCTYWAGSEDGRNPYLDIRFMGRLVTPHSENDYGFWGKIVRFFTARWF